MAAGAGRSGLAPVAHAHARRGHWEMGEVKSIICHILILITEGNNGLATMAAGNCGLAPVAHARREKRGWIQFNAQLQHGRQPGGESNCAPPVVPVKESISAPSVVPGDESINAPSVVPGEGGHQCTISGARRRR